MFEAYKIGVRVSLINNVSAGLATLSSDFLRTEKNAAALQKRLVEIRRLAALSLASMGVAAGGFFGLRIIDKALKPAEDYLHQINAMNIAGLKQKSISDAIAASWKNASDNLTTTVTGNLKAFLDLRRVLGNTEFALKLLPDVTKIQTVLSASSDKAVRDESSNLVFSLAKAIDILGRARNPTEFMKEASQMANVLQVTGGRVTPEMYQQTFYYARQARSTLSDEFLYQILPTLLLERGGLSGGGGGSRGVGPMLAALYRFTNQGYVNKLSVPLLQSLGLIRGSDILKTTTTGTIVSHVHGADLAASNPFDWVQNILLPAIKKKYGNVSETRMQQIVGQIFRGNQLAASLVDEFIIKAQNFRRDQELIKKAKDFDTAYKMSLSKDPQTARIALSAQWENFKLALATNIAPIIVPFLIKLSKGLNELGSVARKYPKITESLVIGFTALSGVMAIGGTIGALAFALKALGLAASTSAPSIKILASSLGKLSLLLGVGYGSYKLGGYIYNNYIAGTSFGDALGKAEASFMSLFSDQAREAIKLNDAQQNNKSITVHSYVHLDGKQVAHSVTKHQANEISKPPSGPNMYSYPFVMPNPGQNFATP